MSRLTRFRVPPNTGIPPELFKTISPDWRAPRHYRDTLRRLVDGDFSDLSDAERQEKVDQIVQMGAIAAMALAAVPVPCLDLAAQAAMVKSIAKVHGVNGGQRALLWRLAGALGLGVTFREGLRLVPMAGGLSCASRAYGAAWALGQAADLYFGHLARAGAPASVEVVRLRFANALTQQRDRAADGLLSTLTRRLRESWPGSLAGRAGGTARHPWIRSALTGGRSA